MVIIVAGCVIGLLMISVIIIIAVGLKYKYSKDKQREIQKTQRHKDKTEEERKEEREDKRNLLDILKDKDPKTFSRVVEKIATDGPDNDNAENPE